MNPLVALYASIPLLPPVPLFSYVTGVPLIASIITLYLVLGYYHHEITTRTPNQLKRQLTAYEMPSIGWRDRLLASYLQRRPTLKWRVWQPSTIFKRNSILCAESPEEFALELAKQAEELSEKKGRVVLVVGGLRGAGKSTSLGRLQSQLGEKMATMNMDAYFKKADDIKDIPGGWDNPRGTDISAAVRAIKAFKLGNGPVEVRTGKPSDKGGAKKVVINPRQTPVLVIEGIHALYPAISVHADYRSFIYVPPGLQEIRTWIRDLLAGTSQAGLRGEKARGKPPDHYLGMNQRVRELHRQFVLPRLVDVDLFYEQNITQDDLDGIGRIAGFTEEEKNAFADAWKLTNPPKGK
ncbi:hypothetical protein HY995_02695 [Candidatus Micrarchaeota archaeon]|nr:hypothetical protein [Candidatus Micrarchaeota archaeon]